MFVIIDIPHFRYIEVFRSSLTEAQRAQYGGGSGGRGGGRGYGGRGGRPGPLARCGDSQRSQLNLRPMDSICTLMNFDALLSRDFHEVLLKRV